MLLNTDIHKVKNLHQSAIKFNKLLLKFRIINETDQINQKNLNKLLESSFRLNMTHLGDSYYRYGRNVYVMPTKQYDIWYNIQVNQKLGEPAHAGGEYCSVPTVTGKLV